MQEGDRRDRAVRPLPLLRVRELHTAAESRSECDQICSYAYRLLLHGCASSGLVRDLQCYVNSIKIKIMVFPWNLNIISQHDDRMGKVTLLKVPYKVPYNTNFQIFVFYSGPLCN